MSVTINGTIGVSGVDGSASTPALQGGDTNTGIFYGTDIVGVSTGGSERMRIDANGNVGIGTSSPGYKLQVDAANQAIIARSGSTNYCEIGVLSGSSDAVKGQFQAIEGTTNKVIVGSRSNHPLAFNTVDTERMRIDSNGRVIVGSSSSLGAAVLGVYSADLANTNTGMYIRNGTNNTGGWFIGFQNYLGNDSGHINQNGTATVAYTTSSDYRLKENVQPMVGALDKVSKLKPVTYTWKDTDGEIGEGFIAHELAEVCPLAVSGEKDAVKEDGSIKPQGIDTSFLVATLTAAIQEQQAIITTQSEAIADLKARIEVLESK